MRACNDLAVCQSRGNCAGCVPGVRLIKKTANEWGLQPYVRELLRAAGAQRLPEQTTCSRHAGHDRAFPQSTWPGASLGVRAPGFGETPLSADEVVFGQAKGIL